MTAAHIIDDIDDPVLGMLSYDPGLDCLAFRVALRARPVWVQLSLESCEDVSALIAHGRVVVARLTELESAAVTAVTSRLAPSDVARRGVRDFQSRFELESVVVYPDGQSSMTFDDGDLFAGRVVLVSLNCDGAFTDSIVSA